MPGVNALACGSRGRAASVSRSGNGQHSRDHAGRPRRARRAHGGGEAAAAYIRGDVRHYFALFDQSEDYTLMPPYGGEPQRRPMPTDEQIEEASRLFVSGDARLDVTQTLVSGDLAVLVAVERQHGVVGGSPDQDWSLRVTMVFRREGDRWAIVHRHADPLVREVSWDHFARLARGDVGMKAANEDGS